MTTTEGKTIDLMHALKQSLARERREHGVMFTAAMVQAILIGRKRETRRLKTRVRPGDLIWCKETWRPRAVCHGQWISVQYRADLEMMDRPYPAKDPKLKLAQGGWRSSMMMPRWAARVVLEVVSAQQERLQLITETAARAEGAPMLGDSYLIGFRHLWDTIHKTPGERFADDPLVTVIKFLPAKLER